MFGVHSICKLGHFRITWDEVNRMAFEASLNMH